MRIPLTLTLLLSLASCQTHSPPLPPTVLPSASASPQNLPTPLTQDASTALTPDMGIDDISSAGGFTPYEDPNATPTPLPQSEVVPEQLGPTALPSQFSPQCPVGDTYTPVMAPTPEPRPTPTPLFPTPPNPLTIRHRFELPLEVNQARFCDSSDQQSWFLDRDGILTTRQGRAEERRQLSPETTERILTILSETQPHQFMYPNPLRYRCQALEVCPLAYSVRVGTANNGSASWSERGNLAYDAVYTQAMEQVLNDLKTASTEAPRTSQAYTYLGAWRELYGPDASGAQPAYWLDSHGALRRYQGPSISAQAVSAQRQLTAAQQNQVRERIQAIDPLGTLDALAPNWHEQPANSQDIHWGFELDAFVLTERRLSDSQIPRNPAGNALRAELQALSQEIRSWL